MFRLFISSLLIIFLIFVMNKVIYNELTYNIFDYFRQVLTQSWIELFIFIGMASITIIVFLNIFDYLFKFNHNKKVSTADLITLSIGAYISMGRTIPKIAIKTIPLDIQFLATLEGFIGLFTVILVGARTMLSGSYIVSKKKLKKMGITTKKKNLTQLNYIHQLATPTK